MGGGDLCPYCGTYQLPRVELGESCTARACQACGWVEELRRGRVEEPAPAPESLPPRYVQGRASH